MHAEKEEVFMDVFEKCARDPITAEASAAAVADAYPYFLALEDHDGPYATYRGHRLIMCGSNNYLGLTTDRRVRAAAHEALDRYGSACTGSRFLNGNLELHERLERELAAFLGKPAALVFPTGYQTNLGTIAALVGRADAVIIDKQNHASIVDACRLSFGAVKRFAHNSMADLEHQLQSCGPQAGKLVVVDGVFSMEGTLAPLPDIVRLCRQYGARLLVDDAHGCGVLAQGRGTAAHFGLTESVDLITITFSKAFASVGGAVLGDTTVIEYIRHHARSLMFSASMSPANTAAAYAALQIMRDEPQHSIRVMQIAAWMRERLSALGYDIGASETPIVPIMIGSRTLTFELWRMLLDAGVFTNPIIPPAAPFGMLRTSYMAIHTEELLTEVLEVFEWAGQKLGIIPQPAASLAPAEIELG
jgi:8-amino-7-oxononanoate synthase